MWGYKNVRLRETRKNSNTPSSGCRRIYVCIERARKARLEHTRITHAQSLLSRFLAQRELDIAASSTDASFIASAVRNAQAAGVSKAIIDKVEAWLEQLRRVDRPEMPLSPRISDDDAKKMSIPIYIYIYI